MKTESPEEKEALDAIENKQCQCAKVNKTDTEITMRIKLESALDKLSHGSYWLWNDYDGEKKTMGDLSKDIQDCLDLLEGKK